MPWNWGRKDPPPSTAPGEPSDPGTPEFLRPGAPLRSPDGAAARFRVQDIYTITGIGCVVVGELESGEIRPNDAFRVIEGATGAMRPLLLQVTKMEAQREVLAVLRPGTKAGLVVRRLTPETGHFTRVESRELRRGDVLVPP